MVYRIVLFIVLGFCCSAFAGKWKPVDGTYPQDIHISLRTPARTNVQLYGEYLYKQGLSNRMVSKGHLTFGWIRDIDPEDKQLLMDHLYEFTKKYDPLTYTFKADHVAYYTYKRPVGAQPLVLIPENPHPYKVLNKDLADYVLTFVGKKKYALAVGTEPESFVPHLTLLHEDEIIESEIEAEKVRTLLNHVIATNRQTFCFTELCTKFKTVKPKVQKEPKKKKKKEKEEKKKKKKKKKKK